MVDGNFLAPQRRLVMCAHCDDASLLADERPVAAAQIATFAAVHVHGGRPLRLTVRLAL
jgi:hypothetical protein